MMQTVPLFHFYKNGALVEAFPTRDKERIDAAILKYTSATPNDDWVNLIMFSQLCISCEIASVKHKLQFYWSYHTYKCIFKSEILQFLCTCSHASSFFTVRWLSYPFNINIAVVHSCKAAAVVQAQLLSGSVECRSYCKLDI